MSKKTTTQQNADAPVADKFAELKEHGHMTLTAASRDELAAIVNQIPADVKYMAGAVGRSRDDGMYSLRIELAD